MSNEHIVERQIAEILARRFWTGMQEKSTLVKEMDWETYLSNSLANWMDAARGVIHMASQSADYQVKLQKYIDLLLRAKAELDLIKDDMICDHGVGICACGYWKLLADIDDCIHNK